MGLKTEERSIRGLRVITTQLTPTRSFLLLPKIGAVLGPALSKLQSGDMALDDDISVLAPVLGEAFMRLSEVNAKDLMCSILAGTSVNTGEELLPLFDGKNIDAAFAGNFKALLETMWFALQVNYSDFLDIGALAQASQASKAVEAKQSS